MSKFKELIRAMSKGIQWEKMGQPDDIRTFLEEVYNERYHKGQSYKDRFQIRVNMQTKADSASYAGWIKGDNPRSGPYQGISFVWFPGEGGSVAVFVIGTDGFGSDTHILGRPGHQRRLRALSRLHKGDIWVKPDILDLHSTVPETVSEDWPDITAALQNYSHVIYAACEVRGEKDAEKVEDLIDLFFSENNVPLTGGARERWERRWSELFEYIFPRVDKEYVCTLLKERRFLILEGPPGTGKTRLAYEIAQEIGSSTNIQFHPSRTYEDFVVGLFPQPLEEGLRFTVRPGDLLKANKESEDKEHVLIIDEINRADLGKVLGEAVALLEVGEADRTIELPYTPEGYNNTFQLNENLYILGTRNTADRTIARMDLAIRRRFAFIYMWPDTQAVKNEGIEFAYELYNDCIYTFTEFADEETLRLIPGHAYFLDPRPDLDITDRPKRVADRLNLELLPLLREYIDEKLCGNASEEIEGLADRIETTLMRQDIM